MGRKPKDAFNRYVFLAAIITLAGFFLSGVTHAFVNPTQSPPNGTPGPISVTDGGTGASTVSGARSNLGAAASGANTDITSIEPSGNLIIYPTGDVGIFQSSPGTAFDVGANSCIGNYALCTGNTNEIWTQPGANSGATLYINYRGYQAGFTQYRSLWIGNGEQTAIMYVGAGTSPSVDVYTPMGINSGATSTILSVVNSASSNSQTQLMLENSWAGENLSFHINDTQSLVSLTEDSTDASNGYGQMSFTTNAAANSSYPNRGGFTFGPTSGSWLTINNLGNVGINTNPSYQFDVGGGGNGDVILCSKAGCLTGYTGTAYPVLKSTGTDLYLDVNGAYMGYLGNNVIHSNGYVYAQSGYQFADGTTQTTAAATEPSVANSAAGTSVSITTTVTSNIYISGSIDYVADPNVQGEVSSGGASIALDGTTYASRSFYAAYWGSCNSGSDLCGDGGTLSYVVPNVAAGTHTLTMSLTAYNPSEGLYMGFNGPTVSILAVPVQ